MKYEPKIDAIITCVDYPDFLKVTLPVAKKELDHVTVVTSPRDKATQLVCQDLGVDFLVTDKFTRNGAVFNKGAATNLGIQNIKYNDWIMCLDADILLPTGLKSKLFEKVSDTSTLYGFDRFDITGYDQYEKLLESGDLDRLYWWYEIQEWQNFVKLPYPVMPRFQVRGINGDVPLGFLQLFHYNYMIKSKIRYPELRTGAEWSDVEFALLWPMEQRQILDQAVVFHLSSEIANLGHNWWGRKTKPFKPKRKK